MFLVLISSMSDLFGLLTVHGIHSNLRVYSRILITFLSDEEYHGIHVLMFTAGVMHSYTVKIVMGK